ncbi:acylphosphatase [Candidatus Bathyarchaeota archaeon]|nr:acylphosphatase [Candidatus Bathyarchaeota archaeon]
MTTKREARLEAYILKVFGRVQRVGFRRYALDSAQELGLAGYAKNLPDGSIEIFVQGEREGLARFIEMMGHPPPPALVKEIRKEGTDVKPEFREFRMVYGELIEELQEGFGAMQSIFADYWREFRDYRQEFKDFRQEFRDYRQEFKDFARRTDDNFKLISDKYGEISEKLTIILETLIRESKETKEMLNETMKSLKEALERLPKAST